VPAASVPVPSQVGLVFGKYNKVPDSRFDRVVTSGAYICLTRLIRLDRMHDVVAVDTENDSVLDRRMACW